MSIHQQRTLDLLGRLVEDRPNTLAGVGEDCHGAYCIYCGRRGWENRAREPYAGYRALRPDHRCDCPVQQGQELLRKVYGDADDR